MEYAKYLPYICIAVGVVGCGLALILTMASYRHIRRRGLAHDRDASESLADLLPYAAVIGKGVILAKDGSLMAAWIFKSSDEAIMTDTDHNVMAARINQAIQPMSGGWMFHVDAFRRRCPAYVQRGISAFPDPVSAAIDDERRDFFEHSGQIYEGCNVLTVTYTPPNVLQQKFTDMMYDGTEKLDDAARTEKILDEFRRDIDTLESRLSTVFKLTRLEAQPPETTVDGEEVVYDEFLRWLNYCVSGENHPVRLPAVPTDIDVYLASKDLYVGINPTIGEKFIQVVTINKFPDSSAPGMLNALSQLDCEYRWSTRYIALDQQEALKLMEKRRSKWSQKEKGIIDIILQRQNPRINAYARNNRVDCEEAITEVSSGDVTAGFYSVSVVLMHEDLDFLQAEAEKIAKFIGELGFNAQIETINNVDAWRSTLPGVGDANVRTSIFNSLNFAHLMPTTSIWLGDEIAPASKGEHPLYPVNSPCLMYCVTSGNSPFRLNLHVGQVGHTIIFGPTGAGKSVLLATLAAQFLRYPGMNVFCFDKGMSMFTLCQATGGQHYDICGDEEKVETDDGRIVTKANYAFCPLQYLDEQNDIDWCASWIESVCALNGLEVKPQHRNAITDTLTNMANAGRAQRSCDDFYTQVSDYEVKEAFQPYSHTGAYGYLFSGNKDELNIDSLTGMVVFELEELMSSGDAKKIIPVLTYIFRRIERNLHEGGGKPAVVFIDEAWVALGHPVFREKLRDWFKVFRKKNCAVIMATQSLSDATDSGILDVIKESTATKIFLPNPYALGGDVAVVYKKMGCNDAQIRLIAEAIPKRQYLLLNEDGSRLFELALGRLQLALVAISDMASVATVKQLIAVHGDKWLGEWLKMRGIDPEIIAKVVAAA